MATNVNVRTAGPSVQDLMNFAVDRFGQAPSPAIPGSQAAAQGVSEYNPTPNPVPALPGRGLTGIVEAPPLSAESTPEDLAMATQSSLANRERRQPVMEGDNPTFDPVKGEYQTEAIPMEQFANQQSAELEEQPNFQSLIASNPMENSVGAATALLKAAFPEAKDSQVKQWVAESEAPLARAANTGMATLMSQGEDAVTSTVPGYEGIPVGVQVMHQEDVPMEYMEPVATVMGIAHAVATAQSKLHRGDISTDSLSVSKGRQHSEDTYNKGDLVNSMIHAATNALDKLGMPISSAGVRAMSEAYIESEIAKGRHKPYVIDGRTMYAADKQLKNLIHGLEPIMGPLTADIKRQDAAKTPQISGSNFIKPGQRFTRNSLGGKDLITSTAEVVKDIFGSIAEQFLPTAMMSSSKQLEDIKKNWVSDETGVYSTSVFAERHHVAKANYNAAMMDVNPPLTFDNTDAAKQKLQADKKKHASSVMTQKVNEMDDALRDAGRLNGLRYTAYSHSITNQRFFRMSKGTDILQSKNIIREVLNFGMKSLAKGISIFDGIEVDRLKSKARHALAVQGQARQDRLMAMAPADRAALGLMLMSVKDHFTFTSSSKDPSVSKLSELEMIERFDPQIARGQAALGNEYKSWLDGKEGDHSNIVSWVAKQPRGEAQAHQNLWHDMASLLDNYNDKSKRHIHIQLSAMNYDDGNQNGIFIQSLFNGDSAMARKLGSYNPNLSDMRSYALDKVVGHLDKLLQDSPDQLSAWQNFFKEANKVSSITSDLLKSALMQCAYGKDASMFYDHMYEFLQNPAYAEATRQMIESGAYGNIEDIAAHLNQATEQALRDVLGPELVETLKALGRMFAISNNAPSIKGCTTDDWFFSPVDLGYIHDESKDEIYSQEIDGKTVFMKKRGVVSNTYMTSTGEVTVPTSVRTNSASASKGTQYFWNKRLNQHDAFENPLGSALSRMMGVMPVQSVDGDLVKLMMLAVNSKLDIPLPVSTVHDAVITSPDSLLLYRNAYNNIAIPQAVQEMKFFAERLKAAYDKNRRGLMEYVKTQRMVGIGEEGDFPALGSYLDSIQDKITNDSYKKVFLSREYNDEDKWDAFVAKTRETLHRAESMGWVYRNKNVAVTPKAFEDLYSLIEKNTKIAGEDNRFKEWVANFKGRVENGFKELNNDARVRKYGLAQMN